MGEEKQQEDASEQVDMALVKRSAKQLNFGGTWEEKGAAAAEIRRLASAGGGRTRRFLAELGIIPSLVSMLDGSSGNLHGRLLASEALIELARGTFKNKVLMVKAGLLTKLAVMINNKESSKTQELPLFLLLLSISSLAHTDFPINPSPFLPLLIQPLSAMDASQDTKLLCLSTLHNLSTKMENAKAISSNAAAVPALLALSIEKRTSEGALAVLGNLVLSAEGKKAVEDQPMVPKALVEVMAWEDSPRCQELAAYLVMVLAHRSRTQRKKMAEAGMVPVLVEVGLLGSSLARRRAMKILQWFKGEGRATVGAHSGPRMETAAMDGGAAGDQETTVECRRVMRRMVRQSLDRNMDSVVRRAAVSGEVSGVKAALVASSSSKSLPY